MIVGEVLGLLGAGVLAGVVSTVVSLASMVSYPALLAFGLPPLAANVTNTVALVFTGIGAAAGSRPELAGEGGPMLKLGPIAALGGATGAGLLLVTPSRTFELIAPWLIAMASLLLVRPPSGRVRGEHGLVGRVALFVVTIYTGYFGAAGGLLVFAVLAAMFEHSAAKLNAMKNVMSGLANAVAALGFALLGPVDWGAAAPLAAGFLLGGWIGPKIARRLPGQSLRYLAAACGLAVAIKLGWDAYAR
ncbi:sulfite exporter TauE/SafE family protein [Nonomuraea zeae]|uniref:Probable membrane transporter protein n=1 Tax=Nonomuraea zeae TaxID=1642303 RepID=A0A5S4F9X5_9ACTN|nr:sulfite exporter TauE/SafE family protein [Nonomuraea zeae]TMR13897.1 sulfite exporter TauE/SafE family protein [Nonomuraea zeae]